MIERVRRFRRLGVLEGLSICTEPVSEERVENRVVGGRLCPKELDGEKTLC